MFAITKVYNRQMLFITRESANPSNSDTTDLVQFLLSEKRAYAPFNNEQDARDRILYILMNGIETRVHHFEKKFEDSLPGMQPSFYRQKAINYVSTDASQQEEINNILGFARYVMQQKKTDANAKEYQLIIKHVYIPPAKPADPTIPGGSEQILFTSAYKPL